jgi:Fic family protein
MASKKADGETDMDPVSDSGESISLMMPLLIGEGSRQRTELTDLAIELAARSAGFRRSLPSGICSALAELVRSMNCYYSNLIEGHNTHPIDIERALHNDYSQDPLKRDLQLEAKAHVEVQKWVDSGGVAKRAATATAVQELHRRFCELLPPELLWVTNPETEERVKITPGALRTRAVRVGQHISISPGAVPRFLAQFERTYANLGKTEAIISAAAAHHRLLWIHPFVDGNGRVARLMSHAMLLDSLDTGSLWSVSRGFARNVAAYKGHLANCDLPRRNDLDGRGNLSEESLVAFTRFFLENCLDQVSFMEGLVQPDRLRARVSMWAEEEIRIGHLPPKSGNVLEAVLYRGELPRGEAAAVVATGERQARRIVAALIECGVLESDSPRATLRLTFPATLASRWMPGLFPEKVG